MIVQGDNGTILRRSIKDQNGAVDLSNATVTALIHDGKRNFVKQGVTNGTTCDFELSKEDLAEAGFYTIQCTVIFQDGKEFSEVPWKLPIYKKQLNVVQ